MRTTRSDRSRRRFRALAIATTLAAGLVAGSPARADEYDSRRAGHPLRIVAYAVHPIGVLLDYAILRPAHWIVQHEPFTTIFGHTD